MTLPMNSSLVVAGRPEWRPDGAPELIAGRAAKRRFSGWTGAGVPDDRAAQYGFQAEGEAAFQDVGVVAGEARGSEDDDWHGSDQRHPCRGRHAARKRRSHHDPISFWSNGRPSPELAYGSGQLAPTPGARRVPVRRAGIRGSTPRC